MNPETEYRKLLESRGISLQSPGLAEIALSRADAILAVGLLRSASIPILGGDVYFKKVTGIESAYANWHSDPRDGEDRGSFVTRSCLDTLHYIENFPSTEAMPIFVLVIDS
jgi:hypothetical protein